MEYRAEKFCYTEKEPASSSVITNHEGYVNLLNELGRDGWHLVSSVKLNHILVGYNILLLTFSRPAVPANEPVSLPVGVIPTGLPIATAVPVVDERGGENSNI